MVNSLSILIPLLFIWGIEWIGRAAILFAERNFNVEGWNTILFLTAIVISVIVICLHMRFAASQANSNSQLTILFIIPMLLLLLACWVLQRIGAVNLFFIPIFQAFLLAIGLVALGLSLGRTIVWMGIWMFALTAALSMLYLGYSPLILSAAGGVTMLAAAIQLKMWRNVSK